MVVARAEDGVVVEEEEEGEEEGEEEDEKQRWKEEMKGGVIKEDG